MSTHAAAPQGARTVACLSEEINPNKTGRIRSLGAVDVAAVAADVWSLPASAWDTDDDFAANYNKRGAIRAASHIVLRFCDRRGTPFHCYDLPVWAGWETRLLPIMKAAVQPYGYARGFFPRIMFARLPAGAFIAPHVDGHPRVSRPHKIHVALATNPRAYFFIDRERYRLETGVAYEVNNATRHAVVNGGDTDRIHLIFEYLDADLQSFCQ